MSSRHLVAEGEGKTDPKRATETKTALQIPNTALQARTQPSKLSQSRHKGLEGERPRWPSAGHAGQSEDEQLEPEEPRCGRYRRGPRRAALVSWLRV